MGQVRGKVEWQCCVSKHMGVFVEYLPLVNGDTVTSFPVIDGDKVKGKGRDGKSQVCKLDEVAELSELLGLFQ